MVAEPPSRVFTTRVWPLRLSTVPRIRTGVGVGAGAGEGCCVQQPARTTAAMKAAIKKAFLRINLAPFEKPLFCTGLTPHPGSKAASTMLLPGAHITAP